MPEATTPKTTAEDRIDQSHPAWCIDHAEPTPEGDLGRCWSRELEVPLEGGDVARMYAEREHDGRSGTTRIHLGRNDEGGLLMTPAVGEQVRAQLDELLALVRPDQPGDLTATRTIEITETAEPCTRFPCDFAYRGRRHRVRDGRYHHVVSSNSDLAAGWRIGAIAFEALDEDVQVDDRWQAFIQLAAADGEERLYPLGEAEAVERLAFGLLTSARRGLEVEAGQDVTA